VNDIAQDEDGFIWIATRAGLNRFDGKDFVKYYGDGSPNHLSSNDIYRIVHYADHRMLIATVKGLDILNTHTGVVHQFIIPAAEELKKYTNRINDLLVDSSKNIIVSTLGGLYVFDSSFHLVFRYDAYTPADLGKKRIAFVYSVYLLQNEKILVPLADSLCVLDMKKKTLESIDRLTGDEWRFLKSGNKLPNIILNLNSHGQCMLGNYNDYKDSTHLNAIDFLKQKIFNFSIPSVVKKEIQWKSHIAALNDSTICINSSYQNGLILFKHNKQDPAITYEGKCLAGIQCNRVFTDRNNRLWVSTDEGVFKQSFYKNAFHNIATPVTGIPDIDNYVNGFAAFRNELFVSAFGSGILLYDDKGTFLKQLIPAKRKKKNQPWNINLISNDSMLISTQSGALLLNAKNENLRAYWHQGIPGVLDSVPITASFTDSHHQLWMGMGGGLGVFMMNVSNHHWMHFLPDPTKKGFPLRYPFSISEDKWGNIWMSSIEGITRWNQAKKIFDTLITRIPGIADDISGQWISTKADKEGNLWICPEYFVLIKWNLQKNQLKIFHQPADEGPLRVHDVKGPWNNNLWMSTNMGLLCFNIIEEKFTLLNKADGMPEENAIDGRIYFDSVSGRMYAGFNNAFTWFYPQDVLKKKLAVNTYITEVREMGDYLSKESNSFLQFSHRNNSISISFTGINYDDGEFNSYAYRLYEGTPADWINIGAQKTVNFANLNPGHYTFQVKTILSDGTESLRPASIKLTISPAFYQTWWFYLLCILIFIAAIYNLYRYRINQLLQVQKVRNNISSDLHDDIGARLTNINILTMLSEQNLKHPEITGAYLARIAGEIQSSGQALDDIVWSINSNNDSITEIIARMRRYAADIFEATSISFQFNSDKKILNRNMAMEQRRDLFLVYKEAITNIQKHALATEVKINVKTEKKQISLTISDNGKGFDMSQPIYRNGLKNMRDRIEKWKGNFIITSSPGYGTTIAIVLP
jgi:ligand-binding sensor domain-containing protein/two-component sensor histidine kinase